jgi:serine protease Do
VKTVVAQLKDKGAVTRGWIGVQIQPVTAEVADSLGLKTAQGALVAQPQPDSPAAKAGIVAGDVVTAVDGEAVKDAHDLARRIGAMAPGTSVKLALLHNGEARTVSLTLGEIPQERQARGGSEQHDGAGNTPRLGLMLAPAGKVAGAGSQGVVVTGVDPDGRAAERGVKEGDVILDVAGKAVSTPAEVRKALADARAESKKSVLMRVKSGDATRFVAVSIADA